MLTQLSLFQAYGAGNYMAVGTWAQRGFCICFIACLPVCAIFLAAEPLLLMVGQTPAVSHMTAAYLRQASVWGHVQLPQS